MAEHYGGNEESCQDTMTLHESSEQQQIGDQEHQQPDEQMLALRRSDNQDRGTGEEQTLALRRSDNQDQTTGPMYTSPQSSHPSAGILESQPSTSQDPTVQGAAAQTPRKLMRWLEKLQVWKHGAQGRLDRGASKKGISPTKDVADICEGELKAHYKRTGGYVQMLPWVDDDKRHITNISTKLESITEFIHHTVLASYEDIFLLKTREDEIINITILNGLSGTGKSTLFDRMVCDWADGSSHALGKYKLVYLLKMHALEQSSDLIDAVFDQLLAEDTDVERRSLKLYVKANPAKLLVLLDGFDELMSTSLCKSSFGSALKILTRKRYRGCHVLVATRPSHYYTLAYKPLIQEPFSHVCVSGFDADSISEYVNTFYLDEQDKAEGLLERIHSSKVLSDLAKSPVMLLLICSLWREDATLPETTTRLFCRAIQYIFKRKADMPPEEISKVLIEMGKTGLRGLLSSDQVLSFKESDFEDGVLDMAIKAGILTRQRVLKWQDAHNSVQFIHKAFQEFCAARYMQSLFVADREEFRKFLKVKENLVKCVCCDYLLRFCCGDNEVCTNEILEALQERFPRLIFTSHQQKLPLDCYFESQSECLPRLQYVDSFVSEGLLGTGDGSCIDTFTYFLKRLADHVKQSGDDHLAQIHHFFLSNCDLTRYGSDLAYCMREMINLQKLGVHSCSLTAATIGEIASSLTSSTKLTNLDFMSSSLAGSGASLAIHLKHLTHIETLVLRFCELTGEDIEHIAESLRYLPNLVELNLMGSRGLAGTGALWFHQLKQLKHLQKLNLFDCALTGEDMNIAGSPSDLPNLVELVLSKNHLGGSAVSWSVQLKLLEHVQKVELSQCALTVQDVEHLAKSLMDLPNLIELDLSSNKNLRGTAAVWSTQLKQLTHLRKLNLHNCSLTDEDVKHVVESMTDLPNLDLCRFCCKHLPRHGGH